MLTYPSDQDYVRQTHSIQTTRYLAQKHRVFCNNTPGILYQITGCFASNHGVFCSKTPRVLLQNSMRFAFPVSAHRQARQTESSATRPAKGMKVRGKRRESQRGTPGRSLPCPAGALPFWGIYALFPSASSTAPSSFSLTFVIPRDGLSGRLAAEYTFPCRAVLRPGVVYGIMAS